MLIIVFVCVSVRVYLCFVYKSVYKHVLNQIPLSPAVALWESIPPALYCSVNDTGLAGLALHIEAL